MPTNYYQEKITSFPGGVSRTVRSAPLANIAKFRAEAGEISVLDIYTDFVSAGVQQFTLKINGVDQIPVPANRPDLNGVDHDVYTPGAPIAVSDGDIISVDLTAVGGAGVNAPLYIRIGIDVPGVAELSDLSDVDTTGVGNGDLLRYLSASSKFVVDNYPAIPAILDDLADVAVPAPADGDVLTFDNGSGLWVPAAPSGGGGSSPGLYSPDIAYGTPNSRDDEFNTGSLDAKWNAIGTTQTLGWTIPNHLSITGTNATNPGGYIQAVSSADITFAAKFILGQTSSGGGGSLGGLVIKNALGRHDTFFFQNSNGNNGIFVRWNQYTTFNAAGDQGSSGIYSSYNPLMQPPIYMKVVYTHTGTTLQIFISHTGVNWYRIHNAVTFGSSAITNIGFYAHANTAAPLFIDWFRVLQGTSFGANF